MRRLLLIGLACIASLGLEMLAALVCPVPQTDLFIGTLIQDKLARAAQIGPAPKLVVLAGSSGLFSHRCEVIEPILGMPCVNASVAVGVGLDYLFSRWKPLLHAGDVIYMPMEPAQFIRSRAHNLVGPENRLVVHGEWRSFWALSLDRELAAILSMDAASELNDILTEPPYAIRMQHIRAVLAQEENAWGDRIGHSRATAKGAQGGLDTLQGTEPTAREIESGYGARLIGDFVRWASTHKITVIGGLSTSFVDIPLPKPSISAMRNVYLRNGGRFLQLAGDSRFPRHDFYDTRYHLYEACQIRYSMTVADGLAQMLGRTRRPAPAWIQDARCGA